MRNVQVAIVGGGLVGLSTALALRQLGVSVAIIESVAIRPSLPDSWGTRVSAVSRTNLDWLKQLGVQWDDLCPLSAPYSSMEVWSDHGSSSVAFDGQQHVGVLGSIVDNNALLFALNTQARAAGVVMIHARCERFEVLSNQVQVVISEGEWITADLLIGADGTRSRIRQWAGIKRRWQDTQQTAIVANFECEKGHDDRARQVFTTHGPLAFLPITPSQNQAARVSIVWSLDRGVFEGIDQLTPEEFTQRVQGYVSESLGQLRLVSERQSVPLYQYHVDRYFDGPVVLVGDAAHQIHPMAGQGVNLGFADAQQLVHEIGIMSKQGVSIASAPRLRRYEAGRRWHNKAALAMMASLQAGFASQNPYVRSILAQGMELFNQMSWLKQLAENGAGSVVAMK